MTQLKTKTNRSLHLHSASYPHCRGPSPLPVLPTGGSQGQEGMQLSPPVMAMPSSGTRPEGPARGPSQGGVTFQKEVHGGSRGFFHHGFACEQIKHRERCLH